MTQDQTTPRLNVLVVDDSEASAQTLGWMIEMIGHGYHLAFDGKSAIAAACEHRPDVILMDIGLPDMDGFETCRQLRADPQFKHTIIMAQTGWGDAEHRQKSEDAGFNYHLVKPVLLDQLEVLLKTISGSTQRIAS